jgi:hypothetical protein
MANNAIATQHRVQIRLRRMAQCLHIVQTAEKPLTFTQIWHYLGNQARSIYMVHDCVAALLHENKLLVLEWNRHPSLICGVDQPLEGYEQYNIKGQPTHRPAPVVVEPDTHHLRTPEARRDAYMDILTVSEPLPFFDLYARAGGKPANYNSLVRKDIGVLVANGEAITLRDRAGLQRLVCRADHPLVGYEGYKITGVVKRKLAVDDATPAHGVTVTELGPGHRLVTFGLGHKSGGGQRVRHTTQNTSSITNLYA